MNKKFPNLGSKDGKQRFMEDISVAGLHELIKI